MGKCSVKGCKSRSSILDDVSFHRYPAGEILKEKWRVALGCTDSNYKTQRICSKHFTADCLKRGKIINGSRKTTLQPEAIPTLNIPGRNSTKDSKSNLNVTKNDTVANFNANEEDNEDIEYIEDDIEYIEDDIEYIEDDIDYLEDDIEYIHKNSDITNKKSVNKNMARTDPNSDIECNTSEIVTGSAETKLEQSNTTLKFNKNLPPETRKLIFKLQRKAEVVKSQRRTITQLRSKLFRLRKKNEKLVTAIEMMKTESLKGHKGPSILLVGM